MKELMKPLNEDSSQDDSLTSADDSSSGAGGSTGALGEFASEALARALSEHGGFGIASGIVKQLSHSGNHDATTSVTGNMHSNTVIKTLK